MIPIEIHDMYMRSKIITILLSHEKDEIVEEFFDSIFQKYQCALQNT